MPVNMDCSAEDIVWIDVCEGTTQMRRPETIGQQNDRTFPEEQSAVFIRVQDELHIHVYMTLHGGDNTQLLIGPKEPVILRNVYLGQT